MWSCLQSGSKFITATDYDSASKAGQPGLIRTLTILKSSSGQHCADVMTAEKIDLFLGCQSHSNCCASALFVMHHLPTNGLAPNVSISFCKPGVFRELMSCEIWVQVPLDHRLVSLNKLQSLKLSFPVIRCRKQTTIYFTAL